MKTCVLGFGVFGIWSRERMAPTLLPWHTPKMASFWLQAMTSSKPTYSATPTVSLELSATSMVDTAAM